MSSMPVSTFITAIAPQHETVAVLRVTTLHHCRPLSRRRTAGIEEERQSEGEALDESRLESEFPDIYIP